MTYQNFWQKFGNFSSDSWRCEHDDEGTDQAGEHIVPDVEHICLGSIVHSTLI